MDPDGPRTRPRAHGRRALVLLLLVLLPRLARAEPCPRCFAVFVMPDTQNYTVVDRQPQGGEHLDLVTRFICQNRDAWTEPSTGKQMPILMVIQLGDLVQSHDSKEAEWQIVRAAFDNLHAERCPSGAVPYLVAPGNHDVQDYRRDGIFYQQYFGAQHWADHRCPDPAQCDWASGQWFLGGGDPIAPYSRNHLGRLDGPTGPRQTMEGRHRAGVIRTPDGGRFLFIGLEMAFDFPPNGGIEAQGDDLRWIQRVLEDHRGVPTLVFHHALFGPSYIPAQGRTRLSLSRAMTSDSILSGRDIWWAVVAPFPQIVMTWNGHFLVRYPSGHPREGQLITEANDQQARGLGGPPVLTFFRNYQGVAFGWNTILVFDPEASEIRVRSYRILGDGEDAEGNPTPWRGAPKPTEELPMDHDLPEATFAWQFPPRAPSFSPSEP